MRIKYEKNCVNHSYCHGFFCIGRMSCHSPDNSPSSGQKRNPVSQTRAYVCLDNRALEMDRIKLLLDFGPLAKNPQRESQGSRALEKTREQLGVDIRPLEKTINTILLN